eukprot:5411696-Amphidinium_carterae.1
MQPVQRPTSSTAGEGARLNFPTPPKFYPLPLPYWAMHHPFEILHLKLQVEMAFIAHHLLKVHLPHGIDDAFVAYIGPTTSSTELRQTIERDFPNLWMYVELVLLAYLRVLHVAQCTWCSGTHYYPRPATHYAHHSSVRVPGHCIAA